MHIDFGTRRTIGERCVALGYGLLLWGLVDRPPMMIVAAAFLIGGYAAIGQSVPFSNRERHSAT